MRALSELGDVGISRGGLAHCATSVLMNSSCVLRVCLHILCSPGFQLQHLISFLAASKVICEGSLYLYELLDLRTVFQFVVIFSLLMIKLSCL